MESDAELFQQQLGADESLVWSGRGSDRLLIRSDYYFVFLGSVLGVIAIGAFVAALITLFDGDGAAAFVGLVVSLTAGTLALLLIFGRLIGRYRRIQRNAYAITNLRVIETQESGTSSVELDSNPATKLNNHFERRGSITVGTIKMENIDDAAVVYEMLQAALAKVRRA